MNKFCVIFNIRTQMWRHNATSFFKSTSSKSILLKKHLLHVNMLCLLHDQSVLLLENADQHTPDNRSGVTTLAERGEMIPCCQNVNRLFWFGLTGDFLRILIIFLRILFFIFQFIKNLKSFGLNFLITLQKYDIKIRKLWIYLQIYFFLTKSYLFTLKNNFLRLKKYIFQRYYIKMF